MIYFARAKLSNLIKIGYSVNPRKRIEDLRLISPDDLETLGYMRGDRRVEVQLHERFSRSHGEWFFPTNELLRFIAENATSEPFCDIEAPGTGENSAKRMAVVRALNDPELRCRSNTYIAKQCGVSQPFVGKIRAQLGMIAEKVLTSNGKAMRTSRLGRTRKIHRRETSLSPTTEDVGSNC